MATVFTTILNMSLTASVIILIVLMARLCLKKAPKIYSYLLWAVVLFRLLCPVSFSLPVSVLAPMSEASTSTGTSYTASMEYISVPERPGSAPSSPESGHGENIIHTEDNAIAAESETHAAVVEQQTEKKPAGEIVLTILGWLWVVGMAAVLGFTTWQTLALKHKLDTAFLIRGNIFESEQIDTAFVLGVINPKIYLPLDLPFDIQKAVIAHEQTHQRRGDHIVKLVSYAALAIHWFNPLVWLSFKLMCDDMEKSCDEAVIRTMNDRGYTMNSTKKAYGHMLLALGGGKQHIFSPVSFAENSTKARVENVVAYNRVARNVGIGLAVVCAVVALLCVINPSASAKAAGRNTNPVQLTVANMTFSSDVTELDLSGRRVDDISALAQCTHLEKLNLSDTKVNDISVLAEIPTLRELDLSDNLRVKGDYSSQSISDLSSIARLTQITRLNLSDMGEMDVSFLSGMTNLKALDLSNNILDSLRPLDGLSNLEELYIGYSFYNDYDDDGPYFPQSLVNLEILDISGSPNTGLGFKATYCSKLRYLDVSHNDTDDISFVSSFPELQYLNLGYTVARHNLDTGKRLPIEPEVLAPLSQCTKLEELDLTDLRFSDISFLSSLSSLKILRMGTPGWENFDYDTEIQEVWLPDASPLANLTGLTELHICGMGIKDISFVKDLSALEVLNLENNEIKDYTPLNGKTSLKELNIINHRDVSNGLFPQGLDNLEKLSFSDYRFLPQIAYCKNLRYIETDGMSNDGSFDISQFPKLEHHNILPALEEDIVDIE